MGYLKVEGRAGERLTWRFGNGEIWVTEGDDDVRRAGAGAVSEPSAVGETGRIVPSEDAERTVTWDTAEWTVSCDTAEWTLPRNVGAGRDATESQTSPPESPPGPVRASRPAGAPAAGASGAGIATGRRPHAAAPCTHAAPSRKEVPIGSAA
jgi:hypothetical protein